VVMSSLCEPGTIRPAMLCRPAARVQPSRILGGGLKLRRVLRLGFEPARTWSTKLASVNGSPNHDSSSPARTAR